jgi:hypothetical protein
MKRLVIIILAIVLVLLPACRAHVDDTTGPDILPSQPAETNPSVPSQPTVSTAPTAPTEPWQNYTTVSYEPQIANGGVTYTDLPELPAVDYRVYDPENLLQLSTERVDHSFGVAANGKPHHITVDNQQRYDGWGTGALAWDNRSQEKVLYLTYDAGYINENVIRILDTMKEKNVLRSRFSTVKHLKSKFCLIPLSYVQAVYLIPKQDPRVMDINLLYLSVTV